MEHNEFAKEHFNQNYWHHYHYSHDPFTTNLENLFFIPPTWEEYLDVMPQFARYCNSLLLITGISGVGKSTLAKLFIKQHLFNYELIYIKATDCPGTKYLLKLLHEKFNTPYDENSILPISEQLTIQIDFLQQNKVPRLLIINEAEQLPLDIRQACLQIVQQQSALATCLPVILIGDKQLTIQFNALLTPKTARECLHTIEISPLTFEQTKDYLSWACEQAGGKPGALPFTTEEVENIFQNSQGIFVKINTVARRLLATKHSANSGWKRFLRGKLLWWGSTIIVIALLLYVYKYISQPTELAKNFTKPIALRQQVKAESKITNKQHKIGNMLLNVENKTKEQKSGKSLAQQKAVPATSNIKPQAKINKQPPIQHNKSKFQAIKNTTNPKKISHHNKSTLFNRVMRDKLAIQSKRVLTINPHNYTLQLLATNDLYAAQHFILQHSIQTTAMLVQTQQQGKRWYVVIYGIFPDKKQALQATKDLTPKLKSSQFWIRSYKSLHQSMQRKRT